MSTWIKCKHSSEWIAERESFRVTVNRRIVKKFDNQRSLTGYGNPLPIETKRIGHPNVCGWTVKNHDLRSEIIQYMDYYLVSINETYLLNEDNLHLTGYCWKRSENSTSECVSSNENTTPICQVHVTLNTFL